MDISNKINEIEIFLDEILENPLYNKNLSLFSGIGGVPIFYGLLHKYKSDQKYIDKIDKFIEFCFTYLDDNSNIIGLTYCDGLCGLGQMLNFVTEKNLTSIDLSEALDSIDEILYENIRHFLKRVDQLSHDDRVEQIDFLHGIFGLAHYLISRPKNLHQKVLVDFFDKLAEIVDIECEFTFFAKSECNVSDTSYQTNLGLAHGHISYILIFSKFYELYPEKENIKSIIKKSAYSVKSFENKDLESNIIFPGIAVNKETANYDVHLGWCYGDQSVAFGLYKAGIILEDSVLIDISKKTAFSTLKRLYSDQIFDAGFCHGSSSVGYLHLKLYLLTKDKNHKDAYHHFVNQTLKFCDFNDGIAGFKKYNGPDDYRNNIGMLDGLIGVGIFLLDAQLQNTYSSWDSFFLLN
ncbi:lanthionine synthetase LanC family protein [Chryseobacterium sp. SIMBA_038]|uniref:lanthionine synthetase LanC family protein n=2 Tax=Bacteria TaxID=2 RepID=UPI00397CAA4C